MTSGGVGGPRAGGDAVRGRGDEHQAADGARARGAPAQPARDGRRRRRALVRPKAGAPGEGGCFSLCFAQGRVRCCTRWRALTVLWWRDDRGGGGCREQRATDTSITTCKKRYDIFKQHYGATMRLKQFFPFHLIDSMGTLEETQEAISLELRCGAARGVGRERGREAAGAGGDAQDEGPLPATRLCGSAPESAV